MARLLAGADLFVHNMSPRAIEGLGLNEKDVRDISPGTIYCIVTGFGTNGPYAGRLAYDDTMQATSGLAHLQGIVTGRPEYVKSAIADQTAAIIARPTRSWPRCSSASGPGACRRWRCQCSSR